MTAAIATTDEQDAEHRFLVAQGGPAPCPTRDGARRPSGASLSPSQRRAASSKASAACRRGRRPPRRPRPHRLARRNRTRATADIEDALVRGTRPRRRARGTAAAPHRLSGRAPRAACRSAHRTRPDSPSQSQAEARDCWTRPRGVIPRPAPALVARITSGETEARSARALPSHERRCLRYAAAPPDENEECGITAASTKQRQSGGAVRGRDSAS
jgi:hypothetical protein